LAERGIDGSGQAGPPAPCWPSSRASRPPPDYLGKHQLPGISLERIRRDRILHEALVTGADPLHLTLVFNIDHTNAVAYAGAARNLLSGPAGLALLPGTRWRRYCQSKYEIELMAVNLTIRVLLDSGGYGYFGPDFSRPKRRSQASAPRTCLRSFW
jgi:hypothetical protein